MKKETRALLRSRALAVAREDERKTSATGMVKVITFMLSSEKYGIEARFVREVFPVRDFTPLPGVPDYIYGLINVRGQILPVINLKKFFNLPSTGLGEMNKVIILKEADMEFGILADTVEDTVETASESIGPIPSAISGIKAEYIAGVTKDHMIFLDAKKILYDKSIVVFQEFK